MAKASGKVTRALNINIEAVGKDKFALRFKDRTSRSTSDELITTAHVSADSFQGGGVLEAVEGMFQRFVKTLKDEDPGELFVDRPASGKPRRTSPKAAV